MFINALYITSWSERVSVEFATFDAQLDDVVRVDWGVSEAMDVGVEDLKICVACWSPIGRVIVKPTSSATLAENVGGCLSAHVRMEYLLSVYSI